MELRELGLKVLKIPDFEISAAITDNPMAIQEAAYSIVSTWRRRQGTGQEAYIALLAGLQETEWHQLTAELQTWVGQPGPAGQISLSTNTVPGLKRPSGEVTRQTPKLLSIGPSQVCLPSADLGVKRLSVESGGPESSGPSSKRKPDARALRPKRLPPERKSLQF